MPDTSSSTAVTMLVTCWPFSGDSSGITAATMPKPTSDTLQIASSPSAPR